MREAGERMATKQPFTCQVCGRSFKDGWEHVLVQSPSGFGFVPKDKAHEEWLEKNGKHEGICFCGGHITMRMQGEDSWETTCDKCEFLYDED